MATTVPTSADATDAPVSAAAGVGAGAAAPAKAETKSPDEAVRPSLALLSAEVASYRFTDGGSGPTYYEVRVTDADATTSTWRRYNDFVALNDTFRACPSVRDAGFHCALPPKRWLNKSATVVAERAAKLTEYLHAVCFCAAAASHPAFVAFCRPSPLPGADGGSSGSADAPKSLFEREQEALAARLTEVEGDDTATAEALVELGVLARTHGRLDEAEVHLERALALRKSVFGPDSAEVAATLNSLGNVHVAKRNYSKATSLYTQAMELQTAMGAEQRVSETLTNLGCVSEAMGKHVEAEAHFQRALKIQEAQLGDHFETAATLSNLGSLYDKVRRFEEAESCMKRAVDILQRLSRGSEDVALLQDTATALQNLGALYKKLRRLGDAESCLRSALLVIEEAFSPRSLEAASAASNLAGLLKKLEKYEAAMPLYQRTRDIRLELCGPESVQYANAQYNLGLLHELLNQLPDAETCFAEALRLYGVLHMEKQAAAATKYLRRVKEKRDVLDRSSRHLLHK